MWQPPALISRSGGGPFKKTLNLSTGPGPERAEIKKSTAFHLILLKSIGLESRAGSLLCFFFVFPCFPSFAIALIFFGPLCPRGTDDLF